MSVIELAEPIIEKTVSVIATPTTNNDFGLKGIIREVFDFLKSDSGKMLLSRIGNKPQDVEGVATNNFAPANNNPNMTGMPITTNTNTQQDFKIVLLQSIATPEGRKNIKAGLSELIAYVGDCKISELIDYIDTLGKLIPSGVKPQQTIKEPAVTKDAS